MASVGGFGFDWVTQRLAPCKQAGSDVSLPHRVPRSSRIHIGLTGLNRG
ncbi:hypothetical protein BH10ACI4_BH10ACI4_34110 [soil metagenome]